MGRKLKYGIPTKILTMRVPIKYYTPIKERVEKIIDEYPKKPREKIMSENEFKQWFTNELRSNKPSEEFKNFMSSAPLKEEKYDTKNKIKKYNMIVQYLAKFQREIDKLVKNNPEKDLEFLVFAYGAFIKQLEIYFNGQNEKIEEISKLGYKIYRELNADHLRNYNEELKNVYISTVTKIIEVLEKQLRKLGKFHYLKRHEIA